MAMGYHDGFENELNGDGSATLHNLHDRWKRQITIDAFEGTSSLRLHVNTAQSLAELNATHESAPHTAWFYITTILIMYLFGLILIFVHYMNSSYGKWMWTLSDAWDELTPAFFNQSQSDMTGSYSDAKQKRSVTERNDELVGEEEEVRFLPAQFGEHNWKANLDTSNVSSGCSGQTGLTSLQSEEEEDGINKDKTKPASQKISGKKFLSPSSAKPKKHHKNKSSKEAFETSSQSCSEYNAKSSSDATVLTAMTVNIEGDHIGRTPNIKVSAVSENNDKKELEDIIVIADEIH